MEGDATQHSGDLAGSAYICDEVWIRKYRINNVQHAGTESEMNRRPTAPAPDFQTRQSAYQAGSVVENRCLVAAYEPHVWIVPAGVPIVFDPATQPTPTWNLPIPHYQIRKCGVGHYKC